MNTKRCLCTLVIAIALLSIGIQATIALQTSTLPKTFNNTTRTITSDIITPQGGGGDPVPGPGIPK